jgi:hypothetical protein
MIPNLIIGVIGLWIFVEALHAYHDGRQKKEKSKQEKLQQDLRFVRIICGLALMVIVVIMRD